MQSSATQVCSSLLQDAATQVRRTHLLGVGLFGEIPVVHGQGPFREVVLEPRVLLDVSHAHPLQVTQKHMILCYTAHTLQVACGGHQTAGWGSSAWSAGAGGLEVRVTWRRLPPCWMCHLKFRVQQAVAKVLAARFTDTQVESAEQPAVFHLQVQPALAS